MHFFSDLTSLGVYELLKLLHPSSFLFLLSPLLMNPTCPQPVRSAMYAVHLQPHGQRISKMNISVCPPKISSTIRICCDSQQETMSSCEGDESSNCTAIKNSCTLHNPSGNTAMMVCLAEFYETWSYLLNEKKGKRQ